MKIATADVGRTHARFALATLGDGQVKSLGEVVTLRTSEHVSFETAWADFARRCPDPLPPRLAVAFAGPTDSEVLKLTNDPWVVRRAQIGQQLGLENVTVVNDFGAVAHATRSIA